MWQCSAKNRISIWAKTPFWLTIWVTTLVCNVRQAIYNCNTPILAHHRSAILIIWPLHAASLTINPIAVCQKLVQFKWRFLILYKYSLHDIITECTCLALKNGNWFCIFFLHMFCRKVIHTVEHNITQLERVHLPTATGLVGTTLWHWFWKVYQKLWCLDTYNFLFILLFFVFKGILELDCTVFDYFCSWTNTETSQPLKWYLSYKDVQYITQDFWTLQL
jgi:hypothetical protein